MGDIEWKREFRKQAGKSFRSESLKSLWEDYLSQDSPSDTPAEDRDGISKKPKKARSLTNPQKDFARSSLTTDDQHQPSLSAVIRAQRILRGAIVPDESRGVLLKEDIEDFFRPRCGHRQLSSQTLKSIPRRYRGHLPSEATEVGWERSRLAIFIKSTGPWPANFTASMFKTAVTRAIATWNHAEVGIELEIANSVNHSHIVAQMSSPLTDAHRTLTDSVLAHADYPSPNTIYAGTGPLPICFSRQVIWSEYVDDSGTDPSHYDLESFALHELGHSLGLFHYATGSIMYETIPKGRQRRLDPTTIKAARQLYTR